MSASSTPPSSNGWHRARYYGAVVLLLTFALGFGAAWALLRERRPGLHVMITASDQLPDELVRLKLTTEQRAQAQEAIRRGRDRVLRVVDTFDPAMQLAIDSTDMEVRRILSASQRAMLEAARKASGAPLQRRRLLKP